MGKIVGITYDLKQNWDRRIDDPLDVNAEFDTPSTIDRICKALESGGNIVKRIGNIEQLIENLDDLDVDIVFNVCEGEQGRNRESQVPSLLEMKGIPFVGADALTLGMTLDKIIAKKMFISHGIPTPRFFEAKTSKNLEFFNTIGFPLMVKTRHEGSSKGISLDSKVHNLEELQRQVQLINTKYNQSALVEEFIKGTEFTVAVIGNDEPRAMPVVQISLDGDTELGEKFYTFDRASSDSLKYVCPALISESLGSLLRDLAVKVYECVECRDFGRVDFRVDEQGNPFCLEINPLPSLDPKDVFDLFPKVIGSDYNHMINEVLDYAVERYGLVGSHKDVSNPKDEAS